MTNFLKDVNINIESTLETGFIFLYLYKLYTMLTKKEVLESFDTLPHKFEAEDAIEKIILLEKIRIGLEQSKAGKVVSTADAKLRLEKWLK